MKRPTLVLFLFALGAFTAAYRLAEPPTSTARPRYPGVREEGTENPIERARAEWLQLRDPKSGQVPKDIRARELAYARTLPAAEAMQGSRLRKGQVVTWTSRGPVNQGGRTRALAYDVSDATGNTILAGGVSGGMWRTTDGGTSWTRTSSLNDSVQSVTCVAQDTRPGHQGVWYYGTGELVGNSASGGGPAFYTGDGMYKSTDGGLSWARLAATSTGVPETFEHMFDYVWNVAVDPTNGNVLAATYGALHRSTDGGTSWTVVQGGTGPYSPYADVVITSTGVIYAAFNSDGGSNGIHRSTDGGTSWTAITPGDWPSTVERIVLAVAPSNENIVYVLAETPGAGFVHTENSTDYWTSFWKYTYVSGDGSGAGGVWTNRSANLPAYGGNVGDFTHQSSYDLVMKVKPDNANFVFIGGTNLYRSSDGFASTSNTAWIGGYSTANDISRYVNHHPDQHALAFRPGSSGILLSGHDGGISRTTNDSTTNVAWTSLNNSYVTSQFYSVAVDGATGGDPTLIGGMQDNGNMFTTSSNASAAWGEFPGGGDGCIAAVTNGATLFYIGTQNGTILRLVPQADYSTPYTWSMVTPTGASGFLFVTPYVLDPLNSNIMYLAGGAEIWRNSDLSAIPDFQNGTSTNWTGLTNTTVASSSITALGISRFPANRLYYGTDIGEVYRLDNALTAIPSTTPTLVTGAGFPSGAYVSCIAVNPRNADTAIAVFSNYSVKSLFLTTNGGSTWTDVSGNLEQNPDGSGSGPSCRWATILPVSGALRIYVGTSTGLYSTGLLNGTSTVWSQEGAGVIGTSVVRMVVSRAPDKLIAVATHGNGIFTGVDGTTSVGSDPAPIASSYELLQNFPNPFNPSTTIHYVVPRDGMVRLTVVDLTGRRIATLVEATRTAGHHVADWNGMSEGGTAAPSGVYFYTLEASGFHATRKMVLMK